MRINVQKSLNRDNRRLLRPTKLVIVIAALFFVSILLLGRFVSTSIAYTRLNDFTTQYRIELKSEVDINNLSQQDYERQRFAEIKKVVEQAEKSDQFSSYHLPQSVMLSFIPADKAGDNKQGINVQVDAAPSDPDLLGYHLKSGVWPTTDQQIVVPESITNFYKLKLGDKISLRKQAQNQLGERVLGTELNYEIVGISDYESDVFLYKGFAVTGKNFQQNFTGKEDLSSLVFPDYLYFNPSKNYNYSTLKQEFNLTKVQDLQQAIKEQLEVFTGERFFQNPIVLLGLVFVAIAITVSCMVIANTFQVLVAQQRKTFALLRAISASPRQIYRIVLREGFRLGLIWSIIGSLIPYIVARIIAVLRPEFSAVPQLSYVSWSIVIITAATVLSVLGPAKLTNKVRPIEALHPWELAVKPQKLKKMGRGLLIFVIICLLLVVLVMAHILIYDYHDLTVKSNNEFILMTRFLLGLLASILLFIGISISTRYWLSKVLKRVGDLLSKGRPSMAIAAANIQTNPRRVGVIGTSLIIGITLLTALATGSGMVTSFYKNFIEKLTPIDIEIRDDRPEAPDNIAELIEDNKDIVLGSAAVERTEMFLSVDQSADFIKSDNNQSSGDPNYGAQISVAVGSSEELSAASKVTFPHMEAGALYCNDTTFNYIKDNAGSSNFASGDEINLEYEIGEHKLQHIRVKVVHEPSLNNLTHDFGVRAWTVKEALPTKGSEINHSWWLRIDDKAKSIRVEQIVNSLSNNNYTTSGSLLIGRIINRAVFFISILIGGLILVSLLIALIGVSNNMILSVIQRREEIASLRIIGMTKRQLRRSIFCEAALICVVTVMIGLIIGWGFGAFGYMLLLGQIFGMSTLTFNYWLIPVSLLIGFLSAWIASVMPVRRALKLSPVEALLDD